MKQEENKNWAEWAVEYQQMLLLTLTQNQVAFIHYHIVMHCLQTDGM